MLGVHSHDRGKLDLTHLRKMIADDWGSRRSDSEYDRTFGYGKTVSAMFDGDNPSQSKYRYENGH